MRWAAVLGALPALGLLLGAPWAPQASLEHWHAAPGSPIPYGFELETLDGKFVLDAKSGAGLPLLFHAYLPEDAALRFMWAPENAHTVDAFLADLPPATHVLFVSYGIEAPAHARMMRAAIAASLARAGLNASEAGARLSSFHFATVPMSGVSDKGANFLPNLMGQWRSERAVVRTADLGPEKRLIERLDAAYEWLPWPPPQDPKVLAPFGDGCTDPVPYDISDRVALIVTKASGNCSAAEMLSRAQAAGAAAAIISSADGADVTQLRCQGGECGLPLRIPGTMVPRAAALELQAAASQRSVSVSFAADSGPGYYAAVDERGLLQEVGWAKLPSLQHLGWAGQWLAYAAELRGRLARPALEIPVLKQQMMQGEHGAAAAVKLPPAEQLDAYTRLELLFELGCPGERDADCPIWDHVVQLFVCCEGDAACDACDATPWLHSHHPEDPAERAWQAAAVLSNASLAVAKRDCGPELGRWVTPFRRRIGAWLTDVTPLRSLLRAGETCRFTAQTAPWALPWKPSLTLRYSRPQSPSDPGATLALHRLWQGGTFNASFNADRKPVRVVTPEGTTQVLLYAVITGHGSDDNQCAEFCPTTHNFTINGRSEALTFSQAGTLWGCTKHVRQGDVPNEHGTWQYGRGGWCDGSNVKPWVTDVTHAISQPGATSEITYEGLFRGREPDPKERPGYIMMESSLVFLGGSGPALPRAA